MKFGSMLSPELREKYKRRGIRPVEGDSVKIMRGEFKGIEGKVTKVIPATGRVTVEGVTREKIAGGNAPIPIHTSVLVITGLNLGDKARKAKLGEREG